MYVYPRARLLSLSELIEIPSCWGFRQLFFFLLTKSISLHGHTVFYLSIHPVMDIQAVSSVLVIMNKAAVNIHICAILCELLKKFLLRKCQWSHGRYIFNFLKIAKLFFLLHSLLPYCDSIDLYIQLFAIVSWVPGTAHSFFFTFFRLYAFY